VGGLLLWLIVGTFSGASPWSPRGSSRSPRTGWW